MILAVVVGFILVLVLGWIPFIGPLVAGIITGYLATRETGGVLKGFAAGIIAGSLGAIIAAIALFFLGALVAGPLGALVGGAVGAGLVVAAAIKSVLVGVGGAIGALIAGRARR